MKLTLLRTSLKETPYVSINFTEGEQSLFLSALSSFVIVFVCFLCVEDVFHSCFDFITIVVILGFGS